MKFIKKRNQYEASNVTFNPETKEAYSYNWWTFVKVINGKVVFNNYSYSPSTSKHQRKVRTLLDKLGIKIDIVVNAGAGLQSSEWEDRAIRDLDFEAKEIKEKLSSNRRKKALDDQRYDRLAFIETKKLEILELREGSKLGASLV